MSRAENEIAGKCGAWMVHLLTASGAIFGLLAMRATADGAFIAALGWMMVTTAIDGVDGALARWRRVKYFLPHFDGALLDNMVDYFTYVIVPAYFLLYTDLLASPWRLPVACAIILASAYQFSRDDAKTPDHAFTGFPSYWNIAVCYLFLLGWPAMFNTAILLACAVGVFVPVRYLYPSRTPHLRPLNIALGSLWAGSMVTAVVLYPDGHRPLVFFSFAYLVYYLGISLWLTLRNTPRPVAADQG